MCRHDQYADAWDTSVTSNIDGEELRFFHTRKNGVDRVWVDHASFLSKVWGLTGEPLLQICSKLSGCRAMGSECILSVMLKSRARLQSWAVIC